jgi:hypothetical protein
LALRITTTTVIMDRASQALAEVFSAGKSVPLLHHHKLGDLTHS